MSEPITVEQRIKILFEELNRAGASDSLPPLGFLSGQLQAIVEKANGKEITVNVTPKLTSLFATAAVEMWQRAVHSFLISASLTQASPIWASVSGYYSSHYCVRGLAHLLGIFQLHRKRRLLKIDIAGGKYYCQIIKKYNAGRGEHQFYWKAVKADTRFAKDPFFTLNPEDDDKSDLAHRSRANYSDHVDKFPTFQPLNKLDLKNRIERLSEMDLSSVPIPNRQKYPDIVAVQLVAYHRIVKFRKFLDETLGGSNRFWKVHRSPNWSSEFLDFQAVEPRFTEVYGNLT